MINRLNKNYLLIVLSTSVVIYSAVVLLISPYFNSVRNPSDQDVILFVLLRIFTGAVYLFLIIKILFAPFQTRLFYIIFMVGFISRIILIPSDPILEDDFNRYLWDGAVTGNLINPYQYSPEDASNSLEQELPPEFESLIEESGNIFFNINHPHIRTIYPLFAQVIFAVCYHIDPFNLAVWKIALLVADLTVFFLLVFMLDKIGMNRMLVFIYWLNPVSIHEFFNAAHMDLLIYPSMLLALLCIIDRKYSRSLAWLSVSAGFKIWPLVLTPLPVKELISSPKKLAGSLLVSLLILVVIFSPVLLSSIDESLGFVKYAGNWTNNEFIFRGVHSLIDSLYFIAGADTVNSFRIARWLTVIFFLLILFQITRRSYGFKYEMIYKSFLIITIMYLISPTQFPWYYTWILPLLVFNPRVSLLLYAALLPLYQLNYLSPYLVWLQHLPVIIIFILEERGIVFGRIYRLGVK